MVQTLEINGTTIAFEARGAGDVSLLFIHGMSCNHEDWKDQLDYFEKDHQVIGVDLIGHGQSSKHISEAVTIERMASDVIGIVNNLGIDSIVLVGHSLGCRVALEVFNQAPHKISKLVLVDGSKIGEGDPEQAYKDMIDILENEDYVTNMKAMFKDMVSTLTKPHIADRIIKNAASMPKELGKGLAPNMMKWDAGKFDTIISKIDIPVLLIQSTYINPDRKRIMLNEGDSSPYIEKFASIVQNLQVKIISQSGHFPMIEKPDGVNAVINRFLNHEPAH